MRVLAGSTHQHSTCDVAARQGVPLRPSVCPLWPGLHAPLRAVLWPAGSTETSLWTHYSSGARQYCGNDFPDGMRKNQRLAQVRVVCEVGRWEGEVAHQGAAAWGAACTGR
jgi:hypothetical protein